MTTAAAQQQLSSSTAAAKQQHSSSSSSSTAEAAAAAQQQHSSKLCPPRTDGSFLARDTSTHTKLSSLPSLVFNLHDFGQLSNRGKPTT